VAALGIVNTLTMGVVERVREIGVLRAAGMTRRQVGRLVLVEGGLLGVVGAALGIVGGLAISVVVSFVAGSSEASSSGPIAGALPWGSIVVAVGLGLGVSVLAAAYPAWLAGRLPVVGSAIAD